LSEDTGTNEIATARLVILPRNLPRRCRHRAGLRCAGL
jgi:hypothetical protein